MKRILSLLSALCLTLAVSASANALTFDLSGYAAGLGTTTDLSYLVVGSTAPSTIYQNTTTGVFTESVLLQTLTYNNGTENLLLDLTDDNGTTYKLYFYADLTGVLAMDGSYTFDVTNLYLVLDTDLTHGNGNDVTLATFELIAALSGGELPTQDNLGVGATGTSNMVARLTSSSYGVFKDASNEVIEDGLVIGFLDAHNTVKTGVTPTPDGYTIGVTTEGEVTFQAVPEPSTFLLIGGGLLGLVVYRKRAQA